MTRIFTILLMYVALTMPAFAADNGCQTEDNDRINPAIALCGVHAYNAGLSGNPIDATERQTMTEIIALKTTVQMQQMKRQFDYLESTIKRFKTQLEKAILTAKLEAAGAAPSGSLSGGSSVRSADRNIILAGTENCNNKSTRAEVYACLRQNYNLIYNMSNGGQNLNGDVRRQLASDFGVLVLNNSTITKNTEYNGTKVADCTNMQLTASRDTFTACMQALNAGIRTSSEVIQQQSRMQSYNRQDD